MTWWYGPGWWIWWVIFVIIFFLLPLGYGWGYRGWGPWYRTRRPRRMDLPPGTEPTPIDTDAGWGCLGVILWIIVIIAIIWLIAVWGGWGRF
jgi:hypothetical protein